METKAYKITIEDVKSHLEKLENNGSVKNVEAIKKDRIALRVLFLIEKIKHSSLRASIPKVIEVVA